MSSLAVHNWLSQSQGHPAGEWIADGSRDSSRLTSDDAWLDVADARMSNAGDAVQVAIAKRILRIANNDEDDDVFADYVETESDTDIEDSITSAVVSWEK